MVLPVVSTWFESRQLDDGVTVFVEPHVDPLLRANIFHVRGRLADLVIDTGTGVAPLLPALRTLTDPTRPVIAVATHAHGDHVGGLHEFGQRLAHPAEGPALSGVGQLTSLLFEDFPPAWKSQLALEGYRPPPVLMTARPDPAYDPTTYRFAAASVTGWLADGQEIRLGDRAFTVLHTPGHSPGSSCLFEADTGILFTGDTLYDGFLYDALPGSDVADYRGSLRRLAALPRVSVVHPGHDHSFDGQRLADLCDAYLSSGRH